MVNWDDWIQCEEDSEMLIYEEWLRYVTEEVSLTQRSKIVVVPIASENSP